MPAGRHKSGTYRKVFVRTPGANVAVHYRKRKPSKAQCGVCGAILKGVPRERPYKMKTMPKSSKRPERPFGGVFCSRCSREKIISEIKNKK